MKADPVEADNGQDSAEFSRLVSIEDLKPGVIEREYSADAAECEALAQRFGVTAIRNLTAQVVLRRKGRSDLVVLEGRLSGEVEQPCVVTLEPVREAVEDRFLLRYTLDPSRVKPESGQDAVQEVMIDPEAEDPPEPAGPEGIDVGEAVAQQLSVAINPYPRAQGLAADGEVFSSAGKDGAGGEQDETEEKPAGRNPFAVLGALRDGKKDG